MVRRHFVLLPVDVQTISFQLPYGTDEKKKVTGWVPSARLTNEKVIHFRQQGECDVNYDENAAATPLDSPSAVRNKKLTVEVEVCVS